jgi:hypothetical protein
MTVMTDIFSMRAVRNTLVAAAMVLAPAASFAGVFISVGFAPPALPVYVQPVAPSDGYLWNPGYWAYGPEGYYWVPGVWVQPPAVGLLWTPGYWGWGGSAFIFHEGYWGPHVGFYGGINYGFGYGGVGFWGGRWEGGHFSYNTAVMNVNRTVIHNTYVDNVHVNVNVGVHTAFNGGAGGIQARPSAQEQQWSHENHIAPTAEQQQHVQLAHADRSNFASANGGHPAHVAAVTVNNYRSTTVNNNHSVTNNNTRVNDTNVHNGQTNVHNGNTAENRTMVNGNHDAAVNNNRPQPKVAPQPKAKPQPKGRPEDKPENGERGR